MKTENKRRLSECIRAGAAIRPQAFGALFEDNESCALGAAYEAAFGGVAFGGVVGCANAERARSDLKIRFPILCKDVAHPTTGETMALGWCVVHLNDLNHWTREQIADFVEKCECEEAAKDFATDRLLAQREPEPVLT